MTASNENELEQSPKKWAPLGLPVGSVRALLMLGVLAVVVTSLIRGREIDVLWVEALLVALAHYFTSRRNVSLPPEVAERLEREGVLPREWHPLFLPRNSIRVIVVLAFVGVAAQLYREHRLLEPQALSLLTMVFAFLLGAFVRGVAGWFHRGRTQPPSRLWGDASAALVLLALAVAAAPEFINEPGLLPPEIHKAALGLVLFYFGMR